MGPKQAGVILPAKEGQELPEELQELADDLQTEPGLPMPLSWAVRECTSAAVAYDVAPQSKSATQSCSRSYASGHSGGVIRGLACANYTAPCAGDFPEQLLRGQQHTMPWDAKSRGYRM